MSTPEQLLALLRHLDGTQAPGRTRVLAIDGRSGTGKTTLAQEVAEALAALRGERPAVVAMDDLYPGWGGLAAAPGLLVRWVLEPIARGKPGGYRRWDWATGTRGEQVTVTSAEWLIVEGVGSGSRVCRPHLTGLVWLEADFEVRRRRGLDRDGATFRDYWAQWARQEDLLFEAEGTRAAADLVIDTTSPLEWHPQ